MADYIPIVSQAKSLVQAIIGDTKGARETQDNFTKTFPVVSQIRGTVELAMGDEEAAKETFKAGATFIDGIPVVGHVKGVVQYVIGDKEGGDAAMISASRTTGVIGGSVGGFVVGGPLGAAAGGVAGGALMDSVTSAVDSLIHDEKRLHGTYNAVDQICDNPTDAWRYLDLAVTPAVDAVAGYKAGRALANPGGTATPQQRVSAVRQVVQRPEQVCNIVKKVSVVEHAKQLIEEVDFGRSKQKGDGCEEEEYEVDVPVS